MQSLDQNILDRFTENKELTIQFGTKKSFNNRTTSHFIRFICNKSKDVVTEYVSGEEFDEYAKIYKQTFK